MWLDAQGKPLPNTGPLRVEETRLFIESARSIEDSGNFTCVAENLAGTHAVTVHLIVSSE